MPTYKTPRVYKEEVFPGAVAELPTGVPVFLGLITKEDFDGRPDPSIPPRLALEPLPKPGLWAIKQESKVGSDVRSSQAEKFTFWPTFEERFGELSQYGYLAPAVRGFFENGGSQCYTLFICFDKRVSALEVMREGLAILESLDEIDLVCVADIMWLYQQGKLSSESELLQMQTTVLGHCEALGDRFAILDSLPGVDTSEARKRPEEFRTQGVKGTHGVLYYPWIQVPDASTSSGRFMPPCGHVAGVYARSDQRVGVHKAPANEVLEGVLDVEIQLTDSQQSELNPVGVNCLRAFPGRGIRVWGARTLVGQEYAEWKYVNVRRLFLTAGRWIERTMSGSVFEPNDPGLWSRITRELSGYLSELFQKGALKGSSVQEAFLVKCDAENNPEEVREAGMVIADIGLAPTIPGEFIVVRISHGASGVTLSTPPPVAPVVPPSKTPLSRRASADVRITHVEYNPPGPDVPNEYVLIQNLGGAATDMTRWTLNDAAYHTYVFPAFSLGPDSFIRIWTTRGKDTASDLYWGRRAAIWNNVGDKAYLRDSEGKLVATYPQNNG